MLRLQAMTNEFVYSHIESSFSLQLIWKVNRSSRIVGKIELVLRFLVYYRVVSGESEEGEEYRCAYRFGINLRSTPADIHIGNRRSGLCRCHHVRKVHQSIRQYLWIKEKNNKWNLNNGIGGVDNMQQNNLISIPKSNDCKR